MSKTAHFLFISLLILVVLITFMFLFINGLNYYKTDLGERFYHPLHESLKPSGSVGHGLGIVGSFLMITGMGTYMARKRYRIFSRLGLLKHWLEVHIFLCTLGPLLIIFHTALKFGGLVAISFWSMVAVFMSGIIGRFIYIQIPHTKEGRELTQNEIREIRGDVAVTIRNNYNLNEECFSLISNSVKRRVGLYESNLLKSIIKSAARDRKKIREIREELIFENIPRKEIITIIGFIKDDLKLNRKIDRLSLMQELFKYWHVAHLPFALVMIIIMVIHVAITVLFGYRWIF